MNDEECHEELENEECEELENEECHEELENFSELLKEAQSEIDQLKEDLSNSQKRNSELKKQTTRIKEKIKNYFDNIERFYNDDSFAEAYKKAEEELRKEIN